MPSDIYREKRIGEQVEKPSLRTITEGRKEEKKTILKGRMIF